MTAAFALPFQAPPVREQTAEESAAAFDAEVAEYEAHPQDLPDLADPDSPAPLRMTKGDDEIRRAIAEPDDLEPDPAGNGRMRLRRGTLRVVLARDGAVLSVRDRKPRRSS
jgi:hypothetical protein